MKRLPVLKFSFLALTLLTAGFGSVPRAEEVYLSDLREKSVQWMRDGYWPTICKDHAVFPAHDKIVPIEIEGREFKKGIVAHPWHGKATIVKWDIHKKYRWLEFYAGITDVVGNGWSEWGKVDEKGGFHGLDRKKEESLTHIRIGAGAGISVHGDGRRIGDTVFVNARTKAELSRFDVTGVQELTIYFSSWGIEPCDAPYHSGGSYPGCPRIIGCSYGDHCALGDAKLISGRDEEPPQLTSAAPLSRTSVKVVFDESVTKESAENVGNYSIGNGIDITAASLESDNTSVRLTTSAMTLKSTYTLTVENITDRADPPNTMRQESMQFTYLEGTALDDGYFTELLCLEDSRDSPFLSKTAASDVEGLYTGGTKAIPYEGQTITVGGEPCRWNVRSDNNGIWAESSADNFVAFWHITVISPARQEVKLAYRHDDDITAWHNGTQILHATGWDNNSEQHSNAFSLVEDENRFLFKLVENTGGNRFAAGIVDAQGGTVPGLLFRFPEASVSRLHGGDSALHGPAPASSPSLRRSRTLLTVSRLRPHAAYGITVTDVRGRSLRWRTAADSEGAVSLSTAIHSGGVYIVNLRTAGVQYGFTTIIP